MEDSLKEKKDNKVTDQEDDAAAETAGGQKNTDGDKETGEMKKEDKREREKDNTETRDAAQNDIKTDGGAEPAGTQPKDGATDKKSERKLAAELDELKKSSEAAKAETAALKDKYLRMMAEYDNFRKRTQKERENAYADAYSDAVKEILPIIDNLERAALYTDAESVSKGVVMTLKSASDTLAKLGVAEIEAKGKKFDPAYHNAVMHVEDDKLGEGEIVEVLQKGYMKGDKVIRYAMVKVAN